MHQGDRAAHFRALHDRPPLVLPNAWDAASARVVELAGAAAVATTSAGVSWALGRSDGQRLRREEMLEAVGRIARAVDVPVTADVESGYGHGTARDAAETARALVALGVAGLNLEDSPGADGQPLMPSEAHAERIQAVREAARAAGGDLVINARTDVFLAQVGEPTARLGEAVRRANLYRAAGADCVFVPGVLDEATIEALARDVGGPLNVMAMPGAPTVSRLAALGVARVSVGPALALVALQATRRAVRELLERGTYGTVEGMLPFGEVNAMFSGSPPASGPDAVRTNPVPARAEARA